MVKVFIAGSRSIKNLDGKIKERINNIISSNYDIIIGDAAGVDSSIQAYLVEMGAQNITIYCSGKAPRNNIGNWRVFNVSTSAREGSRGFFSAKDIKMAEMADYGFMIWDAKSEGTLSNTIQLLKRKKNILVYINKNKEFISVSDISSLESLISCMSEHARLKVEEKIGLSELLASLKNEQLKLI